MRTASVQKEIRDLQALARLLEKDGQSNPNMVLNRAIRRLQELQAAVSMTQKQGVDLRPSKVEENARMAKVGRAYLAARKKFKTPDGSVLDGFHAAIDEAIAR